MAEDAAALAAIIRNGTEAEIAAAYSELIARAGHDAADAIWDEAHNLADDQDADR
jgi:hypothetical protein